MTTCLSVGTCIPSRLSTAVPRFCLLDASRISASSVACVAGRVGPRTNGRRALPEPRAARAFPEAAAVLSPASPAHRSLRSVPPETVGQSPLVPSALHKRRELRRRDRRSRALLFSPGGARPRGRGGQRAARLRSHEKCATNRLHRGY